MTTQDLARHALHEGAVANILLSRALHSYSHRSTLRASTDATTAMATKPSGCASSSKHIVSIS